MKEFSYTPLSGKSYADEDIIKAIADDNVKFVKLQFVDLNGQAKNVAIPACHIEKILNN